MYPRGLDFLQKISMTLMAVLAVFTFVGANLHSVLWQSSDWLISTILPAVVVDLTNDERSDLDSAPLKRNSTLDRAAELKAEHMAENEYFSHFSPEGVSPWYWFDQSGYTYAHAGENLAIHFTDSTEVVEAWMDSPTHRANIVDNKYTEIGVGTARGEFEGYQTVYVVQLFGTPAVESRPVATDESETLAIASVSETEAESESVSEPKTETTSEPVEEEVSETEETEETEADENNQTQSDQSLAVAGDHESRQTPSDSEPAKSASEPETEPEATTAPDESEESVMELETSSEEVVSVESSLISTSSGLEATSSAASMNQEPPQSNRAISLATQPNTLLQIVYAGLATIVVVMLLASIILEARRFHFHQVAYGMFLLVGMAGLWYAHNLLTTGAVIV